MAIDKVNEDDVLLVLCTYCGTQTRVNPRAVEADKPVPCRMCGAPLKIELPDSWERRVRKRSKLVKCERCGALTEVRNTYYVDGMRYCARCNELSHKERSKWVYLVILALIIGLLMVASIFDFWTKWPY